MTTLPPTIRIEAPADMEPHEIAQAIVGPKHRVHVEYDVADSPYRPIAELTKHEMKAYAALFSRMLAAIQSYIEQHILHAPLEKADRSGHSWIFVSPRHLAALRKIIGDHHEAYVAGMISPDLLSQEELSALIAQGILPPDLQYVLPPPEPGVRSPLPPETRRPFRDAYQYGRQLAQQRSPREEKKHREASYSAFRDEQPLPLSGAEQEAIHWAEEHAAEYVRALSKRVQADLTASVVAQAGQHTREAERVEPGESALTREDIRDTLTDNLKKRAAWRTIVTDLGDKSGDWARDLGRIAATEKTRAVQEGQARGMAKEAPAERVRVAKIPSPSACKHCVRLHLTAGPGSPPRIFTLADLQENGTNVGRRAADWQATVGPVHPWCECVLVKVPDGWAFDETGNMVPELLTRAERLARNLRKSAWVTRPATSTAALPERGVAVAVADPTVRARVQEVIKRTPPALFTKLTGITLVTTDSPREGGHMDPGDLAYWHGNEIRLSQTLPASRVRRVLEHEIGHSLNVALFHKLGSVEAVTKWHDELWEISKAEGFITDYAKKAPVENAAEVCRWWIFYRKQFITRYPKQHAFCYRAFASLL